MSPNSQSNMGQKMTERQTVAAHDTEGKLRWFPVADADRWTATTMEGSELFHVAGRWVILPGMAKVSGQPDQIITDDEALDWLDCNGFLPPENLNELAARRRLGR